MTYLEMKNLNNENTRIIIGNPGCGKTTKLVSELKTVVQEGTPLHRIAFCSFSQAAIQEAAGRAIQELTIMSSKESQGTSTNSTKIFKEEGSYRKQLIYFKTLHAMAFHLLGLAPTNLMSNYQYQEFGKLIGYPMSGTITTSTNPRLQLPGDKIMNIISTATLENVDIKEHMIKHKSKFPVITVESIAQRYQNYKSAHNYYDFTDMLLMAKERDLETPPLDYLFIDEAQDLSRLSWALVDKLAGTTKNIIIAGDDKQTINLFSGADIQTFLHLPGKVEVLEQSYRVPRRVFNLANTVREKMSNYRKEGANWKPRNFEGKIVNCNSIPYLEMCAGDWDILGRTVYQLSPIKDHLLMMAKTGVALPFTVLGQPPVDMDIFRTAALFEDADLQGGDLRKLVRIKEKDTTDVVSMKYEYITLFKKFISCYTDTKLQKWEITEEFLNELKKPWLTAMDKVPWHIRLYVKHLLPLYREKGDAMFDDSKIRVTTIHRAKGTEAQNVVVIMNLTRSVKQSVENDFDDAELKTFYVAITRARENLYLYTENKNDKISYNNFL